MDGRCRPATALSRNFSAATSLAERAPPGIWCAPRAVQAGDVTLVGEVVDVQLQAQVRAELPGHEGVQRKGLGVAFVDLAGIADVLARDRIADAGIVEIGGRQGACARTRNPRRP